MTGSALERCVGDTAAFLDLYWGRRSQHLPASGDFRDLISVDDLDALLARSLLPTAAFRLVRDGGPIPDKSYTRPFGGRRSERLRVADPTLVWDEFYAGATIVVEGLHKYWGPLADFCRALEDDLGHPTQVNAYVTPPGSQGFSQHVDVHDVFVLQIHGEKMWEVADGVGSDKLEPAHLRAGDCLYIPTDCAHSARTSAAPSIHLTVGVLVQTWGDLATELLTLARTDPRFSERVPVERHRDESSVDAVGKETIQRLQEWAQDADPGAIGRALGRRLLTSRHERHEGMLLQLLALPELTDASELERVASGRVTRSDDGILLLLSDRELSFPFTLEDALGFVLARDRFVVADLGAYLDEAGRLALARRLIREGLLIAQRAEG